MHKFWIVVRKPRLQLGIIGYGSSPQHLLSVSTTAHLQAAEAAGDVWSALWRFGSQRLGCSTGDSHRGRCCFLYALSFFFFPSSPGKTSMCSSHYTDAWTSHSWIFLNDVFSIVRMYSFSTPQRAEGGLLQSDLADHVEPAFMTAHACFLSPLWLHSPDRDRAPSPAKQWGGCCSPALPWVLQPLLPQTHRDNSHLSLNCKLVPNTTVCCFMLLYLHREV